MPADKRFLLLIACLALFLDAGPIFAEGRAERAEKAAMVFAVFGDNSYPAKALPGMFKAMKGKTKADFIIGMGDHFSNEWVEKQVLAQTKGAYGTVEAFLKIFYPVIGDNEDQYLRGGQGDHGACLRSGWLERVGIAKRDGTILRKTVKQYDKKWGDYYAVIEKNGVRLHLVMLYQTDTMDGFYPESRSFGEQVCREVKKKFPDDPLIVAAHNSKWWKAASGLPEDSPILKADMIMEASSHAFAVRDEVPGDSLAFNTCSVPLGHWFEVQVYKDRMVLVAIMGDQLGRKGYQEPRKVWIKYYGRKSKKPYPAEEEEIKRYAGKYLPPAAEKPEKAH